LNDGIVVIAMIQNLGFLKFRRFLICFLITFTKVIHNFEEFKEKMI